MNKQNDGYEYGDLETARRKAHELIDRVENFVLIVAEERNGVARHAGAFAGDFMKLASAACNTVKDHSIFKLFFNTVTDVMREHEQENRGAVEKNKEAMQKLDAFKTFMTKLSNAARNN